MSQITFDESFSSSNTFHICFVCLGNICRSPTAEGIFQHAVNERGLEDYFVVDSAGTSAFHIGEPANSKSRKVALERGVELTSKARQFTAADLDLFHLIIVMDDENKANVRLLANTEEQKSKIHLMREFDPVPEDGQVPDPYYGGISGFHNVFDILERSSNALLDVIEPYIAR